MRVGLCSDSSRTISGWTISNVDDVLDNNDEFFGGLVDVLESTSATNFHLETRRLRYTRGCDLEVSGNSSNRVRASCRKVVSNLQIRYNITFHDTQV
jgi:hypothetical protein